jgi:hypothetical protein
MLQCSDRKQTTPFCMKVKRPQVKLTSAISCCERALSSADAACRVLLFCTPSMLLLRGGVLQLGSLLCHSVKHCCYMDIP